MIIFLSALIGITLLTINTFATQADPAQALNVPVVPLGTLLAAAYPLSSHPPYVLSWLNLLISAEDMMHPEMLKKLVLNNFCKCKPTFSIHFYGSSFIGSLDCRYIISREIRGRPQSITCSFDFSLKNDTFKKELELLITNQNE